jgi:hypothetical protein
MLHFRLGLPWRRALRLEEGTFHQPRARGALLLRLVLRTGVEDLFGDEAGV